METLLEQFSRLEIARYQIVLQAQSEAVLPALIGSTLRGAFGHALKAISCCVPHRNCQICFLPDVCLYTTVFEPTSQNLKDIPRPFIFEPPIPPLTKEVSENSELKLRVSEKGKISFDLILIGDTIKKMPYFVYAIELLARHGLGRGQQSFSIAEILLKKADGSKQTVYIPDKTKISTHQPSNLALFVESRLSEIVNGNSLKVKFLTPLRIRRKDKSGKTNLLEKIFFSDFFKQCSLRLKFLMENYGKPIEYDYQNLMRQAENVGVGQDKLWRHDSSRYSNRQESKIDLDGMLGEIEFQGKNLDDLLPIMVAGEILHIGSASSLGLGKYSILETI